MAKNDLEVNKIIEKIYNGEYNSKDDIRMALRLILNANGTELEEQKNRAKDLIQYSTNKRVIDGEEYIPVQDALKIISES